MLHARATIRAGNVKKKKKKKKKRVLLGGKLRACQITQTINCVV